MPAQYFQRFASQSFVFNYSQIYISLPVLIVSCVLLNFRTFLNVLAPPDFSCSKFSNLSSLANFCFIGLSLVRVNSCTVQCSVSPDISCQSGLSISLSASPTSETVLQHCTISRPSGSLTSVMSSVLFNAVGITIFFCRGDTTSPKLQTKSQNGIVGVTSATQFATFDFVSGPTRGSITTNLDSSVIIASRDWDLSGILSWWHSLRHVPLLSSPPSQSFFFFSSRFSSSSITRDAFLV